MPRQREIERQLQLLVDEWLQILENRDEGKLLLYDGTVIPLLNFQPADFNPEYAFTILPNIDRYNGNSYIPVSVGQHSLLAHELAELLYPNEPLTQFFALIHDFPGALTGDLISPIKHLGVSYAYRKIEERVWRASLIALKLENKFNADIEKKIKLIDKLCLSLEVLNLHKYPNHAIWKDSIFSFNELQDFFKLADSKPQYPKDLVDLIISFTPQQVEVKLRNRFNKLKPKS